jgi:hypothetical protein
MHSLLTREKFKELVFKRDKHKCICCAQPAVDAHHLLERKLFTDGGYYLNNGVSLCAGCHLKAETTELTVEELRQKANIIALVLPINFQASKKYDKWGNELLDGNLIPGPLFNDKGCQTMLAQKPKR